MANIPICLEVVTSKLMFCLLHHTKIRCPWNPRNLSFTPVNLKLKHVCENFLEAYEKC